MRYVITHCSLVEQLQTDEAELNNTILTSKGCESIEAWSTVAIYHISAAAFPKASFGKRRDLGYGG
jgi:hypothetical protein